MKRCASHDGSQHGVGPHHQVTTRLPALATPPLKQFKHGHVLHSVLPLQLDENSDAVLPEGAVHHPEQSHI
ncbi:hypothetical protein TcWFU_005962 [Taenia crassiceps]|uniref:Uncharacterized protein n=1 Tax=Taenia crassiceps TaxID=6207 RepID=A0ABR4QBD5_9CEST